MISFSQYILFEGQLEDSLMRLGASKEEAKKAIARWRDLNDAQKKQIPNPQQYTKKKGNTFKDFIKDLESAEEVVSSNQRKKLGIEGLKKGEDYLEFETGDPDIQAYAPLHWEASKVIASKNVGSCEGKWCVAYQKDSDSWVGYTQYDEGAFIYLITPKEKYAVLTFDGDDWELFDSNDKPYNMDLVKEKLPEIYAIADKMSGHYEKIREEFPGSWEEIAQEDDVESFAKKYRREGSEYSTHDQALENICLERAENCFDWLAKNIGFKVDRNRGLNSLYHTMLYGGIPEWFDKVYADIRNSISLDVKKENTDQSVLTACILIADRDMSFFKKILADKQFVVQKQEIDYLQSRAEIFLGKKHSKEMEEVEKLLAKKTKELGIVE